MKCTALFCCFGIALAVSSSQLAAQDGGTAPPPVTLRTLLAEMADLDHLATFPDPPFVTRQFSSYDRASVGAGEEGWFANGDAGKFLRVEDHGGRNEWVLADAEGPGAVVRIWSANPKGTLRIYLDGAAEPVIAAPMDDLLGGRHEAFPEPLAGVRSRGWNLYFPIPFREHLKITSDAGGFYYHVTWRQYPEGTEVPSFTWKELREVRDMRDSVCRTLTDPEQPESTVLRTLVVGQGATETVLARRAEHAAGEALCWLGFAFPLPDDASPELLRGLVLQLDFDGERTAAVPLGDFFGAAPGICNYESLPLSVVAGRALRCCWVMPYRERMAVSLRSHLDREVTLYCGWAVTPRPWTARSLHFHAGWRQERDMPTRPFRDWCLADVPGPGVFVGAALYVANPVRGWWGEGDEKIYLDGEAFPSTFGTGTEDYFGYAWCCNETFEHAYHAQPRCDGPGNYGYSAVNRWHIIDAMPFRERFRFDIEVWHSAAETTVSYASTVYWYAAPGAGHPFPPLAREDLAIPPIAPYEVFRVAGALEGEKLAVLERAGSVVTQHLGPRFSGEEQLWWRPTKPGDRLVLGFEVAAAGRYRLCARFCHSWDYGIHQLSVNGKKVLEPVDLHAARITAAPELDLGTFEFAAGVQRLGLEVVGINPSANPKNYMAGLDYLRLVPVK